MLDAEIAALLARATARISAVIFLGTFAGAALAKAWPSRATEWLAARRAQLLLALPVAHAIHYGAVVYFATFIEYQNISGRGGMHAVLFGLFIWAVMVGLAATAAQSRAWHTPGLYLVWLIFAVAYSGRMLEAQWFYLPLALAFLAAPLLRWKYLRAQPKAATAAA